MFDGARNTKITGFGLPFGSVSWETGTTAKEQFQYLFEFLRSKRIFDRPYLLERKEFCAESVLEIRAVLVEITKGVSFSDEDIKEIRSMIDACNAFLDSVTPSDEGSGSFFIWDKHCYGDLLFAQTLKNYRNSFKKSVKVIEKRYSLKYEGVFSDGL